MEKNITIFSQELADNRSSKITAYDNFRETWNTLISKISNFG
jgi:hypothetical protein